MPIYTKLKKFFRACSAHAVRLALTAALLGAAGPALSAAGPATSTQPVVTTRAFSLSLGASRVIYRPGSAGAEISVSNPQSYPVLVQADVVNEDKKTPAPFIVTPPLSRLEAGQQSRLRIIGTAGGTAGDRETLQWLCVSGIPPKNTDVWAQGAEKAPPPASAVQLHLEVSARECVKLLTRPAGLPGNPVTDAARLQWHWEGDRLDVSNPSPFYMNLASVSVGGKPVLDRDYVAPYGTRRFHLPAGAAGLVRWQVITDEGGVSHAFESPLK